MSNVHEIKKRYNCTRVPANACVPGFKHWPFQAQYKKLHNFNKHNQNFGDDEITWTYISRGPPSWI